MKYTSVSILFLLLPVFLWAQSVNECMECHSDEELTKFEDDTIEVSLHVDLQRYQNSLHGELECVDCHSDIEDAEHEAELAEVSCGDCHEDSFAEYDGSIHATSPTRADHLTAECKDCHGSHYILPSDKPASNLFVQNIEKVCGNCHSKPEVIKLSGINGGGPVAGYNNSVHEKILQEDVGRGAPTCTNCHGYHSIYLMSDPRSSFNKLNRAETCGTCHVQEKEEYLQSIHWRSVQRGHFESPTCNDCHGEHRIVSPQETDAITNRLNLSSQICANCHSSQTMMARFGLDHERFLTYQKTYHGLAVLKGSPDAANCTSCHEIHAIREGDSPLSSVHPDNLTKTCGKCHENITAEFINISAHPKDMTSRNPYAFFARNIYIWLIILTIGGMIIHNIIILRYYINKKRQMMKYMRTVQRFLKFEVYQHALLILSFVTLVITGFALKFTDALWVEWLNDMGMDESLRSLLHRIAAVILIIISLIQLAYFIFFRRGRREILLLRPVIGDVTGFIANIKFHLGFSENKPRFGRWDYTEKAEYLALIWGTAVMVLTGLVLWFPEFFMGFLPFWMFEVSEVVHYFEAWLATLAIIVWHWFFVIYHPERYPMSLTWMNGKITEEELKHHHPLEYEELKMASSDHKDSGIEQGTTSDVE